MASGGTTPYNSIYSYIAKPGSSQVPPPPPGEKKAPCCLHGKVCPNQDDEESAPYVNLMKKNPPVASESDTRREKNLRILSREMKTLQLGEESIRHKKSHKKSRSTKKKESRKKMRSPGSTTMGRDEEKKSRKKSKDRERSRDKSRKNRKSKEKKKPRQENDIVADSYLGIKTWNEAEAHVSEPSTFRLYHRMGMTKALNQLEPNLPLFIVYKCSTGKYKHYRLRQVTMDNTTSYMVEHGQMNTEFHASLEHLVRFYHTQVYHHTTDGQPLVDVFPCWSPDSS